MIGAIIGDLAGSIYEFGQTKQVFSVKTDDLIDENAFFSDDTILTIAVLDSIINHKDYGENLRKYTLEYADKTPQNIPYFKKMFSPGFLKWANSNEIGESFGNGALMRISPVGFMFNTQEEVQENAIKATAPSHNTQTAINDATTVALVCFYAKSLSKQEIIAKLNLKPKYTPFTKFNSTCQETLGNCLYAVFSSNSFEESIKKVLSFGGDTDTNACIVGSMAEALYGVPEHLVDKARKKLPDQFLSIIDQAYNKLEYNKQL